MYIYTIFIFHYIYKHDEFKNIKIINKYYVKIL